MAVQWLGLYASSAGGIGLIPGWGTKIPQAGDITKYIYIYHQMMKTDVNEIHRKQD